MEEILKEVSSFLNIEIKEKKNLKGTTESEVVLLNNKYIVKKEKKPYTSASINFLEKCNNPYFPKLVYKNEDKDFFVYENIEGNILDSLDNVNTEQLLKTLYQITKNYPDTTELYGSVEYKFANWFDFLMDDLTYCQKHIDCLDSTDFDLVKLEIDNLKRFPYKKVLMHGDFGVHNFIFKDNELKGVIDPQPVIGDPLYDYFSACVSNVSILKQTDLETILSIPEEPRSKMKSMLLITLYNRIERCIKHHPNDLNFYLELFNQMKAEYYHYYINNMIQ